MAYKCLFITTFIIWKMKYKQSWAGCAWGLWNFVLTPNPFLNKRFLIVELKLKISSRHPSPSSLLELFDWLKIMSSRLVPFPFSLPSNEYFQQFYRDKYLLATFYILANVFAFLKLDKKAVNLSPFNFLGIQFMG